MKVVPFTHSPASIAGEALRMVGVTQGCDHPSFHIERTDLTFGTKHVMVVFAAVVLFILHEVTT